MDGYVFDNEEWSASFQLSPATLQQLGGASKPSSLPAITPAFVPIVDAASIPAPPASQLAPAWTPEIEIDTGGTKIRLAGGVDTKALTAVLRAVRAASS